MLWHLICNFRKKASKIQGLERMEDRKHLSDMQCSERSLVLSTEKAGAAETERPFQVELRSGILSCLASKWGWEARDRKSSSRRWQRSRQETGWVWTSVFVVGQMEKAALETLLREEEPDSLMSFDQVLHCLRLSECHFYCAYCSTQNTMPGSLPFGLTA